MLGFRKYINGNLHLRDGSLPQGQDAEGGLGSAIHGASRAGCGVIAARSREAAWAVLLMRLRRVEQMMPHTPGNQLTE